MQPDKIHQSFIQSGAGSTPITPLARPFTLAGNEVGILIIHGYGGSIADYLTVATLLNSNGYSVYGIRLAGHGQGQETLRQVTIPDCQRSVTEAITEAKKTCRHIFLLGSSFGGVLSLDYVSRQSTVSGIILVNTALSYSGAGKFQGVLLRIMRVFTPDYPKKGLTDKEKEYAKSIGSSVAWPINGILSTARFAKQSVVPKLPTITIPALIIHSQKDPVVSTRNSKLLATLLGSTKKQIVTLPVATHRPFRNQEANQFMATKIHTFIQEVLAKS